MLALDRAAGVLLTGRAAGEVERTLNTPVGGDAIRGDASFPADPVPRGCARVGNETTDRTRAEDLAAFGTTAWVFA